MWVDPDSSLSWEQILEKVWRESSPEAQAKFHQEMAASGKTWDQLCREARAGFQATWAAAARDPEHPFARKLDFMKYPVGRDPLLERSDP